MLSVSSRIEYHVGELSTLPCFCCSFGAQRDMAYNNLTTLPEGVFQDLTNLEEL